MIWIASVSQTKGKFTIVACLFHEVTKNNNQQQVTLRGTIVHLSALLGCFCFLNFHTVCPKRGVKWSDDAVSSSSSCVLPECISGTCVCCPEVHLQLDTSQPSLSDLWCRFSSLFSIDETLQYPSVKHTALLSLPLFCSLSAFPLS